MYEQQLQRHLNRQDTGTTTDQTKINYLKMALAAIMRRKKTTQEEHPSFTLENNHPKRGTPPHPSPDFHQADNNNLEEVFQQNADLVPPIVTYPLDTGTTPVSKQNTTKTQHNTTKGTQKQGQESFETLLDLPN